MAAAIQKITLSPSRDIPFNTLALAQANVRRAKAGISIEQLAADIARRDLLQSLNVRPILDNWLRRRRKTLWISKSDKLIEDAQCDWSALGMERLPVTPPSRFPQGRPVTLPEGILFTTYATLRSDEKAEKVSRVRQIVDWLGSDCDGVIICNESHAMQNAGGSKGERDEIAPSQQGRAGLRLQHAYPDASIVSVSATPRRTVGVLRPMSDRLRSYGLLHKIISRKLRTLIPTDMTGVGVLAKVMERHPVARISKRNAA
jgi:hypothetical protein